MRILGLKWRGSFLLLAYEVHLVIRRIPEIPFLAHPVTLHFDLLEGCCAEMGPRSLTALVLVASASAGPVPNIHAIEHASVLLSYDGPGPAEFHLYSDPVDQKGEGLVSTHTRTHMHKQNKLACNIFLNHATSS